MRKATVLIGRFQPFTRGHQSIVEFMKRTHPDSAAIVAMINRTPGNLFDRNPFTSSFMIPLIEASVDNTVRTMLVMNADLVQMNKDLARKGLKLEYVMCGPDRFSQYKEMIDKYLPGVSITKIVDTTGIRASKVREALRKNDINTFKKYMPRNLANEAIFKTMRMMIK